MIVLTQPMHLALVAAAAFAPRSALPNTARLSSAAPLRVAAVRRPVALAATDEEPLDEEEVLALAGVWRAALDLDDGERNLTCHLDPSGRVFSTGKSAHGTGTAPLSRWQASKVRGSRRLNIQVQLGPYFLTGRGTRAKGSLRCAAVQGSVLEGSVEPNCCGRFNMSLSMPATANEELPTLEARHQARLDARPPPPIQFQLGAFAGRWRLLLGFDGSAPAIFTIRLNAGAGLLRPSWQSEGEPRLAGTWGVWSRTQSDGTVQPLGTHLWLQVSRERSSSDLRGIGGLPVFEAFSLWARPTLDTPEAELSARVTPSGGRVPDSINGQIFFGTSGMSREYAHAGRFSLIRVAVVETEADESEIRREGGDES